MRKNNSPKKTHTRRERSLIPWRYGLLMLGCGAMLIVGFFFAAQQHFASIDFSIKNSRLKKQIEELETSKRNLLLAKEIAMSPAEIKKAAQKLGFRETMASSVAVFRPNPNPAEEKTKPANKPEAFKTEDKKPEKLKEEKKSPDGDEKKDNSKTQIARR
ncbi:MAG: hypothetical protein ACR2HG_14600 [Pyrinomonadaceae bacterium]